MLNQFLYLGEDYVLLILQEYLDEGVLALSLTSEQESYCEFKKAVSHCHIIRKIILDGRTNEFGTVTGVKKELSLFDWLFVVQPIRSRPRANIAFLVSFRVIADDVVGEKLKESKFQIDFEEVGVDLIHFHEGFDHFRASDHYTMVLLKRQLVYFRELLAQIVELLHLEFRKYRVHIKEGTKLFAARVQQYVFFL